MTTKAITVANYIVENIGIISSEYGEGINNLHLQKILYYLQANYMVENEGELLFNDNIEKWKLGPVVPDVYHAFKSYGPLPIKDIHREIYLEIASNGSWIFKNNENSLEDNIKSFIDRVLPKLLIYDKFKLVELTHKQPMWAENEKLINSGVKNIKYHMDEVYDYFLENPKELLV